MDARTLETTVDIAAPVERVWRTLTDFGRFPEWSRFILAVEGRLQVGQQLNVRLHDGGRPMQMRPRLVALREGTELRWRGAVGAHALFSGEHYFRLEPLGEGATRLTHGEVFSGLLTRFLWKALDTRTRRAFHEFNKALRHRSEAGGAA